MYRFILAIVLIIILSLSLKYILLENFSIRNDQRVLRAIEEHNIASRKEREAANYDRREIGRYNSIKEMEHIVQNLRDKVISAKEIINSDYPTCRKIDLYPNIDFSDVRDTDDDDERNRFTADYESSYRRYNDLIRRDAWNGRSYGNCSNYNPIQSDRNQIDQINQKKSRCRIDPYCRVVVDNTNTNEFSCEYKQLNHKCYTRSTSEDGTQPVTYYINPGTLDNI